MSLRNREKGQVEPSENARALEPTSPIGRREDAADLRTRAAALREAIAGEELALETRRSAAESEAGALEARARELEAEQDRLDRAEALRQHAHEIEAAARDVDAQVSDLDAEIVDTLLRTARLEHQLATDFAERRIALQRRAADATAAGDTDSLVDIETELASLPAVEQRLREEAATMAARAGELDRDAGRLESITDHRRRHAALLRRHADTDPLAARVDDPEHLPEDDLEHWGGRRSTQFAAARTAALSAIQALPELHAQDTATVLETFTREKLDALQTARLAAWTEQLDELAELIGQIRETATAMANPRDDGLIWADPRDPLRLNVRRLDALQTTLGETTTTYTDRTSQESRYRETWPGQADLTVCSHLATSRDFRTASEVVAAAAAAAEEIGRERQTLEAAAAADDL